MTTSFSFFWKKLNPKKVTFKNLRKTYFTAIEKYTLGSAINISGHSHAKILKNYYIDSREIAKEILKLDIRFF